ncbi:hypothetical protein HY250_02000 [Candidatus Azambacteria bacterium]|nr:hypothetical protein [Candidatus Azambacteria bacterium]
MKQYWFRPKRFWGWWAAYYPVSWQGWAVFCVAALALLFTFARADADSHSASDTLIRFAPSCDDCSLFVQEQSDWLQTAVQRGLPSRGSALCVRGLPSFIAVLFAVDLFTHFKGEYPSWWKGKKWKFWRKGA